MLLYQGDCLEEMNKIPDGSVDLILTDPPYGTTACKWDSVIPFEPMWAQLKRVAKKNAAIVLFGSEPFSSALRMSNLPMFKYDWVWSKVAISGFALANKQPLRAHEIISVFYSTQPSYIPQLVEKDKPLDKRNWKGDKRGEVTHFSSEIAFKKLYTKSYPKSVLEYNARNAECNNPKRIHPTQKPIELLEYLIRTYTNEGETVLDFTMGSGSTGVACVNTGRKFIGIELDDKYYSIAYNRIKEAQHIVVLSG